MCGAVVGEKTSFHGVLLSAHLPEPLLKIEQALPHHALDDEQTIRLGKSKGNSKSNQVSILTEANLVAVASAEAVAF